MPIEVLLGKLKDLNYLFRLYFENLYTAEGFAYLRPYYIIFEYSSF